MEVRQPKSTPQSSVESAFKHIFAAKHRMITFQTLERRFTFRKHLLHNVSESLIKALPIAVANRKDEATVIDIVSQPANVLVRQCGAARPLRNRTGA